MLPVAGVVAPDCQHLGRQARHEESHFGSEELVARFAHAAQRTPVKFLDTVVLPSAVALDSHTFEPDVLHNLPATNPGGVLVAGGSRVPSDGFSLGQWPSMVLNGCDRGGV